MPVAVLLLALGCAPPTYDVSLRLPDAGALVVTRTARSLTRTPLGPENIEIKSTKRLEVLAGGKVGVDVLHWREEFVRYEVSLETRDVDAKWALERDEDGALVPLPDGLRRLGPHPPREVWVHPDRRVEARWLPWPEPEAEAPAPDVLEEEVAPPPEPDPPVQIGLDEIDNFIAGLVLAPTEPAKRATSWSWTVSQRVTQGGEVSNTSTWTLDRVAGKEAVLVETLHLQKSSAPARDEFRTTALTGSGEMRLDTRTGLPTSYTSMFEAALASPSARGSSTMKVDARFRWRAP